MKLKGKWIQTFRLKLCDHIFYLLILGALMGNLIEWCSVWYSSADTQVSNRALESEEMRYSRIYRHCRIVFEFMQSFYYQAKLWLPLCSKIFLHLFLFKASKLHFLVLKFNTVLVFRGAIVTYATSWESQRVYERTHIIKKLATTHLCTRFRRQISHSEKIWIFRLILDERKTTSYPERKKIWTEKDFDMMSIV